MYICICVYMCIYTHTHIYVASHSVSNIRVEPRRDDL